MLYRKAVIDDCSAVTSVVQNTKAEIYPKYYPKEVVISLQICIVMSMY